MGFSTQKRKTLRLLEAEKREGITLEDVLSSDELARHISNLFQSLKNGDGSVSKVKIIEADGEITAYTDGETSVVNRNCDLIKKLATLEAQYLALMGFPIHEKAHDLFMDWNLEKQAAAYIKKGLLFGRQPTNLSVQEDADMAEMMVALNDPVSRQIFEKAFHNLSNIIADCHDEEAMIDYLGDYAAEPLYVLRSVLQSTVPMFEDQLHELANPQASKLAFIFNMTLQICRFDELMAYDHDEVMSTPYWATLKKIRDHARIACVTDDTMRKFSEMNYIMVYLWPYIREEAQKYQNNGQGDGDENQSGNQQSGGSQAGNGNQQNSGNQNQSGSQSGNQKQSGSQQGGAQQNSGNQNSGNQNQQSGNGGQKMSEEAVKQILQALDDAAKKAGATADGKNKQSSKTAVENRVAAQRGEEKKHSDDEHIGAENVKTVLEALRKQMAKNQAESEMESAAASDVLMQVATVDQTSSHKDVQINASRELAVGSREKATWENLMRDLIPISKRSQKQLLAELRDLNEGYTDKRKFFGKHLDASDSYRLDQRCWSTKKLPEDYPDMAVSILIDSSGSMSGRRMQEAMRAAMLVYDFCTGINIPVAVAGHSVGSSGVNYRIYTEHEQIGKNDKYRLAKLTAGGCNRDGAAINISAGILSKRSEKIKLLVVISDGQPNDREYGGEAAAADIRSIVRKYKNDVEIVAAAIGDDQENIKKIYQNNFLSISDLNKLPKELIKIVKKRIYASM